MPTARLPFAKAHSRRQTAGAESAALSTGHPGLRQNRFAASSEHMPTEPVPCVGPPGKGVLQPIHTSGKVGLGCLQQQVIMVRHQDVGVNPKPRPVTRFSQCSQKCLAVFVVLHNGLAPSHDTWLPGILSALAWASSNHHQIHGRCRGWKGAVMAIRAGTEDNCQILEPDILPLLMVFWI